MSDAWNSVKKKYKSNTDDMFNKHKRAAGLYPKNEINNFDGMYRFGKLDPYNAVNNTFEVAFFTKPDLHIIDKKGKGFQLNPELASSPFFNELIDKYPNVIYELQSSTNTNPLSNLLFNTKKAGSNLEVPSLSSTTIDTPANVYGTSYDYRGSSEASNDNIDFSIEFTDNKYLDTYMYFKAYEEYQILKSHGLVSPTEYYITNKIIHDSIGIYKFVLGEDFETILYYGYYWGVFFKSLPRDVFSNTEFGGGLSYSIDCRAAFFDDMDPLILRDFNALTKNYRTNVATEDSPLYKDRELNGEIVKSAYITTDKVNGRKVNKLKWRV